MLEMSQSGALEANLFRQIPWLVHSFGTRHSDGWAALWPCTTARQIHSDRAVISEEPGAPCGEADAIITVKPGHVVGVRTAD